MNAFLEHLFQSSPDNSVDGPPTHRTVIGHSSVRDGSYSENPSKPTGADTQPNAGRNE